MSIWRKEPLPRDFFSKKTETVAKELLGCYLVHHSEEGVLAGQIVETEAYLGQEDPACHSARGKSQRNRVMFGPPGMAYIYFIYGMYYCFNVTSDQPGIAAAVLIRALKPVQGLEIMKKNRNKERIEDLCSGPAKLVQAMGISSEQNGMDLTGDTLYFSPKDEDVGRIIAGPRIGISKAADWPLRYYIASSPFVSR